MNFYDLNCIKIGAVITHQDKKFQQQTYKSHFGSHDNHWLFWSNILIVRCMFLEQEFVVHQTKWFYIWLDGRKLKYFIFNTSSLALLSTTESLKRSNILHFYVFMHFQQEGVKSWVQYVFIKNDYPQTIAISCIGNR